MDDLEFRRRILSDPKQKDEEILQALAASDANSKFVDDVLDLDAKIKQAMNVDVPEDLADKILFSQTSSALDEKSRQTQLCPQSHGACSFCCLYHRFTGGANQLG